MEYILGNKGKVILVLQMFCSLLDGSFTVNSMSSCPIRTISSFSDSAVIPVKTWKGF